MRQLILSISIIFFFIACSEQDKNQTNDKFAFENFYVSDTLTIKAEIGDCGEWGGHIERFDIFREDNDRLALRFQKDTVNCSDPARFNRRMIEEWKRELTASDQTNIIKFIQNLTKMTFKDEGISNGGDYYHIERSTKGLSLRYSNYSGDWTGFKELKKKINKQ